MATSVLFAVLIFSSVYISQQYCPSGWRQSPVDEWKCYLLVSDRQNWFDADESCNNQATGAVLTSVTTSFETAFLRAMSSDSSCTGLWIGANDIAQNGTFVWVDNKPFQYTSWQPGQPDLSNQCVQFDNGQWKTDDCDVHKCSICEVQGSSTSARPPVSTTTTPNTALLTDCYDWLHIGGARTSGIYKIYPPGITPFNVYCDMTTNGGGWTLFQRRRDASLSFYDKTWVQYKHGFGTDLTSNHWLGNDRLHLLTNKDDSVDLRIDIHGDRCVSNVFPGVCTNRPDRNGYWFGEYEISVDDESNLYTLTTSDINAGNLSSPQSEGFFSSNGQYFSTNDRPNGNDYQMRQFLIGAGWYNPTIGARYSLNGKYHSSTWGIFYHRIFEDLDYDIVPISTEMKLRKKNN